jgi:hypothetical protein
MVRDLELLRRGYRWANVQVKGGGVSDMIAIRRWDLRFIVLVLLGSACGEAESPTLERQYLDCNGMSNSRYSIGAGEQRAFDYQVFLDSSSNQKWSWVINWDDLVRPPDRLDATLYSSDGLIVPASEITRTDGDVYVLLTVGDFLREPGKVDATPWQLVVSGDGVTPGEQRGFTLAALFDNSGWSLETSFSSGGAPLAAPNPPSVKLSSGQPLVVTGKVAVWTFEGLTDLTDFYVRVDLPSQLCKAPLMQQMFDDGTNGDATANDGVFTATIADTIDIGAYTVTIWAGGPTAGFPDPRFNGESVELRADTQVLVQ